MTKQEKIREGIQQIGHNWFCSGGYSSQMMPNERSFEGDIINYLHSQGVVIKVDKPFRIGESVNDDGLVAVEPLIGGENGK